MAYSPAHLWLRALVFELFGLILKVFALELELLLLIRHLLPLQGQGDQKSRKRHPGEQRIDRPEGIAEGAGI